MPRHLPRIESADAERMTTLDSDLAGQQQADVLYAVEKNPPEPSSSEKLVRSVVRGMYEGRYVPGQRLVELDLMKEYQVSRATVREAIKQLKADGIISTHPYRGAQIRKLTREDAINILSVVEVIIGLAARQAAQHIDEPGARERLTEAIEELVNIDANVSSYEFMRRRNHFYNALIRISGNHELGGIMQKMQVHLIRNRLVVSREERIAGYRELSDLVLRGDAAGAEDRARRYARRTADLLLPLF